MQSDDPHGTRSPSDIIAEGISIASSLGRTAGLISELAQSHPDIGIVRDHLVHTQSRVEDLVHHVHMAFRSLGVTFNYFSPAQLDEAFTDPHHII